MRQCHTWLCHVYLCPHPSDFPWLWQQMFKQAYLGQFRFLPFVEGTVGKLLLRRCSWRGRLSQTGSRIRSYGLYYLLGTGRHVHGGCCTNVELISTCSAPSGCWHDVDDDAPWSRSKTPPARKTTAVTSCWGCLVQFSGICPRWGGIGLRLISRQGSTFRSKSHQGCVTPRGVEGYPFERVEGRL